MQFIRGTGTAVRTATLLLALLVCAPAQAWTLKVLHRFTGGSDGADPNVDLVRDKTTGDLYGVTSGGGDNGKGVVFKFAPDGTETILYAFRGAENGDGPASLIRDDAGNLYGTTWVGGDLGCDYFRGGCGVVFKLAPDGTYTVLHTFTGSGAASSTAKLTRDPHTGDLYGTTSQGGANNKGAVFKLAADGTYTVLHSFDGRDGDGPIGRLVRDTDGTLYGTTEWGGDPGCRDGTDGCGVVFKLAPDGSETVLYAFTSPGRGFPSSGLRKDASGNLYGTGGGFSGRHGSVFKLRPNGNLKTLHTFMRHNGAKGPHGDLLLLQDSGTIIGTTLYGGPNDGGVAYSVTLDGTYTVLHEFRYDEGLYPSGGLVKDDDGNLFGTTAYGPDPYYGMLFELVK